MTDFTRIPARTAEIGGGVAVARTLPSRLRRTIGAWCFLDHAGPATFADAGMRVGPHPHTCLQTFTWMIEGEVLARSSTAGRFRTGARVFHQKFGPGTIAAVDGAKLTVDFDKAGRKMVLESFVQAG